MEKQFKDILPEETKKVLKDVFRGLKEKVLIEVFTRDEEGDQFDTFTAEFVKGISKLTDKIDVSFYKLSSGKAKQKDITRSPLILIGPDKYRISYIGAPVGEEARTLIMSIMLVSNQSTSLSDIALKRLYELKGPRHIQVFVSPTCPYCPQQAINAVSAAVAMPDLVSAEIIEMYENRDYMEKYHIITVPFTAINDVPIGTGVKVPEVFVEELHRLTSVEKIFAPMTGEVAEMDIVIIGGGPAGLTAGIYAGRSGLKSVVLEKTTIGGQVLVTPVVENYPGFEHIAGKTLVDILYQQALHYTHIMVGEAVIDVKKAGDMFELKTNRKTYRAKGIIIVTGVENKKLNVSGESTFYGNGVSYCATCDGYYFKDGKKVIVVGGGNTAATDALYLQSIGAEVSLVHRRDRLRAEAFLSNSLLEKKIPVYWNTEVKEIIGTGAVTEVALHNLKDNTTKKVQVDGVFIAVGYLPNNEVAKMLGLALDKEGYIKVDSKQRTSMERVYAAGDITGGVKQIATAVGQGTIAAITVFEDLSNPYWMKK